jgi:hypothetical protein
MGMDIAGAHGCAAGCDHAVEFYETEDYLVATVAEFLVPALLARDSAIVIATPEHRSAFATAFGALGIDIPAATRAGRYLALDAAELLAQLMPDGTPDPERFERIAGEIVDRASRGGRRVMVYGEMVALLWAGGDVASTIAVEDMWNDLAVTHSFGLLCAYPMRDFDDDSRAAFKEICARHSEARSSADPPSVSDAEHRRIVAELRRETSALRAELASLHAAARRTGEARAEDRR